MTRDSEQLSGRIDVLEEHVGKLMEFKRVLETQMREVAVSRTEPEKEEEQKPTRGRKPKQGRS